MIWRSLHFVIVAFYLVAPPAAIVIDGFRSRRRNRSVPGAWLVGVVLVGVMLGTSMSVIYAFVVGGKVRIGQTVLASYFAVGLLLMLRMFDRLIQIIFAAILRVSRFPEKPSIAFRARLALAGLGRMAILFGIGMPYVMASIMTYRPKVELNGDPEEQLSYKFEPVEFRATDGTKLSGWWIPAETPRGRRRISGGQNTVLICHGLASNKSTQLILARGFVPYGYNVLIFDFRAHGASGGQLTSFGDLERKDVLGAVRWIRENHNTQAQHIYGVGASMGAAALIGAAADPSPEGQAIDAIAAYGSYDSVRAETFSFADDRIVAPFRWLLERFGLPLASAQVGADLSDFSPAILVRNLWPRPIMVIHGMNDEVVSFPRGEALFQSAGQPKSRLWIDHAGQNDVLRDNNVAERVREFFQTAEPVPVI
jgi:uncharacterized protein